MTRLPHLAILLLLLGGCATTSNDDSNGRPDWVDGASSAYPADHYLLGRGQAEQRALAQDRARSDLAKTLSVVVTEQSRDLTRFEGERQGDTQQQRLTQQSSRDIATRTEQLLEGVTIAELWRAGESETYHALAVLDRMRAAKRLRREVSRLDRASDESLALARGAEALFEQLRFAARTVDLQRQRHNRNALLQAIDPTGQGVTERYSLESLQNDLNSLLGRITIAVRVLDDPLGGLESLIGGIVAESGFRHAPTGADYRLDSRLQVAPLERDGWVWYRGSLQLTLHDAASGRQLALWRWPVKASASDEAGAADRLRSTIGKHLEADLFERLTTLPERE